MPASRSIDFLYTLKEHKEYLHRGHSTILLKTSEELL